MRRAIDYAAVMSDEVLDETLFVRISKADRDLLNDLASRMPLKAAALARIALRIGLAEIDRDPARIFAGGKTTKAKR
jgi:hypothetical protein